MTDLLDEEVLDSNESPKTAITPKGSGANPKIFIAFGGLFFLVLILVAVGIISYRSHASQPPSHNYFASSNETASTTAIDNINQKATYGALNKSSIPQTIDKDKTKKRANNLSEDHTISNHTQPEWIDNKDKQAAQSEISVINNFRGAQQVQSISGDGDSEASSIKSHSSMSSLLPPTINKYHDQNMQKEKAAFIKASSRNKDNNYITSQLDKPISPYEIQAGTLIPASLMTGINSDLPGEIVATVSRNIYDSVSGNYLMIPQGTKVIGAYDSQVAYGQERVLMAWSRLIFPNGTSFNLQGMPGVDLTGMSGMHDLVNNHYLKIFGSALMFSLFGAAGQLSQPQQGFNNSMTNQQIIYGAIGQQLTQTGAQLVQKNINIQPTLEIRPGANFNILLTRDMVLPKAYSS